MGNSERKHHRNTRTAKDKLKVLSYLSEHTVEETVEKFGCHKSMLTRWKRQTKALESMVQSDTKRKNLSGAGRPIQNFEMENKALLIFNTARNSGNAIGGSLLQRTLLQSSEDEKKNSVQAMDGLKNSKDVIILLQDVKLRHHSKHKTI